MSRLPVIDYSKTAMEHHSPGYSLSIRLRYADLPGILGKITSQIGEANGLIGAIDIVDARDNRITRDITVNATTVEHGQRIVEAIHSLHDVEVVQVSDRVFLMHLGGKLEVTSRVPIKNRDDLSMAYTPGVARVCEAIHEDEEKVYSLTIKKNMVAVVSDGSAVLGLGNLGPKAALPVMEGKAILFKEFGGVDAFPICLDSQDPEQIIEACRLIAPVFGGINLEDISAPRCVDIEERLEAALDIPVFHDDQHGTAIVVLAALTNALKVVGKTAKDVRVVINGAGAAGAAVAKLLLANHVEQLVVCDRQGAIYNGRSKLNSLKQWLAEHSNPACEQGSIAQVIRGADVFIGVSSKDVITPADVGAMSANSIVFALANPDPEIRPHLAAAHAKIVATGRSDYPNQINNVLCFPGLFRGLLDVRARNVDLPMKLAAAQSIAGIIPEEELRPDYIVPSVFDRRVAAAVAEAVARAAKETGAARCDPAPAMLHK